MVMKVETQRRCRTFTQRSLEISTTSYNAFSSLRKDSCHIRDEACVYFFSGKKRLKVFFFVFFLQDSLQEGDHVQKDEIECVKCWVCKKMKRKRKGITKKEEVINRRSETEKHLSSCSLFFWRRCQSSCRLTIKTFRNEMIRVLEGGFKKTSSH